MFSLLRKKLRHKARPGSSVRRNVKRNVSDRVSRTQDMAQYQPTSPAKPILYTIGGYSYYGTRSQLSNIPKKPARNGPRAKYGVSSTRLSQNPKIPRNEKLSGSSDGSISEESEKVDVRNFDYDSGFQSDERLNERANAAEKDKKLSLNPHAALPDITRRPGHVVQAGQTKHSEGVRISGDSLPKDTESLNKYHDTKLSQDRVSEEVILRNHDILPELNTLSQRSQEYEDSNRVYQKNSNSVRSKAGDRSISRRPALKGVAPNKAAPGEARWKGVFKPESTSQTDKHSGSTGSTQSSVKSESDADSTASIAELKRCERVKKNILCSPSEKKTELCAFIDNDITGAENLSDTHFGTSKMTYLDYVASGRPLKCIETYIRYNVMPSYANTHTEVSFNAQQTTKFREEARSIIRECVNASSEDVVIFTGSGSTAAINKLVYALNISNSRHAPIVFVGPYEHHSNILPWREVGATVITIRATPEGVTDLEHLSMELQKVRTGPSRVLIGSFSAASNVTGILTDVDSIASMMHRHGGYALFDYACAAPYVEINMNPTGNKGLTYKDAIFISTHKFVGGPQTPGVLIAKHWLFRNEVPHNVGGGTVVFVRRTSHKYLSDLEHREEGGTPAIIESIRAGLVFKLKEAFTPQFIMSREHEMLKLALDAWTNIPELLILGNTHVERLPIFPMLFLNHATGRLIHHDFVAMVLNDLFGIQVRSGCACAGPYGMDLLGMPEKMAARFEQFILDSKSSQRPRATQTPQKQGVAQGFNNKTRRASFVRPSSEVAREQREDNIIFKPGFVRLNFPYFLSEKCFDFVLKAVRMTAEKAWTLLPLYDFDRKTGAWWYRFDTEFPIKKSLHDVSFSDGTFNLRKPSATVSKGTQSGSQGNDDSMANLHNTYSGFNYDEILERAEAIFEEAMKPGRFDIPDNKGDYTGESEQLRWFMLPREAADIINKRPVVHVPPESLPFFPEAMEDKLLSLGRLSYSEKRDGTFYQAYGVENIPLLRGSCSRGHCQK